jgi:hypothetical protein
MFARVLGAVLACFFVGALLMLAQRRTGGRTTRTAWGKFVTYLLFVVVVLALAQTGEVRWSSWSSPQL